MKILKNGREEAKKKTAVPTKTTARPTVKAAPKSTKASETDAQKRDRMYKDAVKSAKRTPEKGDTPRPSSAKNGTTTRSPAEYFSGKQFDETTRKVLRDSGVDD